MNTKGNLARRCWQRISIGAVSVMAGSRAGLQNSGCLRDLGNTKYVAPKLLAGRENTNVGEKRVSVYERIAELGITLPEVTPPVAAFVPFVRSGNQIFVSGHIAKENDKPWVGQLGLNMTTELRIRAARVVAIDLLATLNLAVGDLNKITRVVKLMCLVNSAPTFTEQHLVANGASELLAQVFGAAQLPFGSCVEIDLIAEVRER